MLRGVKNVIPDVKNSNEESKIRQLYFGDNIKELLKVNNESVDLIYLDPPFNSKREYSALFRSRHGHESHAQIIAFEDFWNWGEEAREVVERLKLSASTEVAHLISAFYESIGKCGMLAYIAMMTERLIEMHRVLKKTGSIYLHCDPVASHYMKLVLDAIFHPKNFRNEIIWKRTSAHSNAKRWGPIHDTIFFYSKSDKFTWNKKETQKYEEGYLDKTYDKVDHLGRFCDYKDLTGSGIRTKDSGKPWRGINPTEVGRHWAVPREILAQATAANTSKWTTQQKLDALDAAKLIYFPKKKGGKPLYIKYPDEGMPIQDVITDIPPISPTSDERLGFPTQKPQKLLKRIIGASSNPGDIILDPFCGCGTAIYAAEELGRQWIGIDITHLSIRLIEDWLIEKYGVIPVVDGTPASKSDATELWERNKYDFEKWALSLVHARSIKTLSELPHKRKGSGADGALDGEVPLLNAPIRVVVSVKGGKPNSTHVSDLAAAVARDNKNKTIGILVELQTCYDGMYKKALEYETVSAIIDGVKHEYPKLQIFTIKELMDRTKQPTYPGAIAVQSRRIPSTSRRLPTGQERLHFPE